MASPLKSSFFPSKTAFKVEMVSDFPKRRGREKKYISLAGFTSCQMYSVLSTYRKLPCIRSSKLKILVVNSFIAILPNGIRASRSMA